MSGSSRIDGFTLIETLVSMSVIAISLSIIMGLFSGGLKSKQLSEEYSKAIFHSQENMETLLLSTTHLSVGTETGSFNDIYAWETQITESQDDIDDNSDELSPMPENKIFKQYLIRLTVKWKSRNKEKTFSIQTIKLEFEDEKALAKGN